MLKAPSLIASLCLFPLLLFNQILPQERIIEWEKAGRFVDFTPTEIIDITSLGAATDGSAPVEAYITQAINELGPEGGVVYLPAGTYWLSAPVELSARIVLRGDGIGKTMLQINHTGEADHGIIVSGQETNYQEPISTPLPKGTKQFVLDNLGDLDVGDYVVIREEDQDLIHNVWATYSTGQINQVKTISDNLVRMRSPLRREFREQMNPRVVRMEPVEQVGIEDLSIERLDASNEQVANIFFDITANCWVKCIESKLCNWAHIELRRASNCEVSGSYIRDAWNHGGGGKAYGVIVQYTASENLVFNNIFERFRHSILLQSGANGNVISYNYSRDPYWTGTIFPADDAGELVLHGNYPYSNLFEGNIVQNVAIDDSHGFQGPNNTFLRNKIEGYGLVMGFITVTNRQNFIGNQVTGSGLFSLQGDNHFLYGNNVSGNTLPAGTEDLADVSYYLESAPTLYFQEVGNWPAIGYPNTVEESSNEAFLRYELEEWVVCNSFTPPVINSTETPNLVEGFQIFPNPASTRLQIIGQSNIERVLLMDLHGRVLLIGNQSELELPSLESGLYLVRIETTAGESQVQKLFIQQ